MYQTDQDDETNRFLDMGSLFACASNKLSKNLVTLMKFGRRIPWHTEGIGIADFNKI